MKDHLEIVVNILYMRLRRGIGSSGILPKLLINKIDTPKVPAYGKLKCFEIFISHFDPS